MNEFCFKPIGYLRSDAKYTQETPRQGAFSRRSAVIELEDQCGYSEALKDLSGVSHIWIIWVFDRVENWKPLVQPPTSDRKIGVFATRSPHRPNPIGITAARLVKVEKLKLYVDNVDLLDGTPILDIKPYIAAADVFEDSKVQWLEDQPFELKEFSATPLAAEQGAFLLEHGKLDLLETSRVQLATRTLDPARQRLILHENSGILAFRTWRIYFDFDQNNITVTEIKSGYSQQELAPKAPDKYKDLNLHRLFLAQFGK